MGRASRPSLLLLAVLFFGSGVSALIYQVLWLRLLALVFGVTVHAATTVLASFMGGLALGSALAGRVADRASSPLRWFGLVEIAVGALALATHVALPAVSPWYAALQSALPDGLWIQTALRFVGSFAILLAPTTLMGMTLPLMLKAAEAGEGDTSRRIGVLYATNTAGAVLGALLTGYVLIGAIGITSSFRVAASINLIVGIVSLVLPRPAVRASSPALTAPPGVRLPFTAVAVFALSGFAALALEVVWFRVLVYFVPATSYAFSTMLAAVLLGLALGSYAATPLLRQPDRLLRRLVWIQFATCLAVPLAATAIASAYRAGWHTTADIHISVVLAFPPAFLMGMSYPLGLRLWGSGGRSSTGPTGAVQATRVGDLNSANLLGGIVGAVVGGFLVLPLLGTRAALVCFGGVYALTFVLLVRLTVAPRRTVPLAASGVLAFVLAALTVPDMLEVASNRRYPADERPFWRQEGAQTTVAVRRRADEGVVLYLDGLHQASDAQDMVALHRLIGHLPMALHPDPRRAIVVGLGGGVTPGAVSQHDTSLEVVELSSSVVEAARWFAHVNYAVTSRSNVRLRVDDGRNFLASRAGHYDVITADLIQPEHAGAGHLYSREYFALMRHALADGGLALQWIGHRSDVEYKLMLRTFLAVFPEATLWAGGQLMLGSTGPLAVSRDAFERKLRRGETRSALETVGLAHFDALIGQYVAGPEELRAFAGDGPLLTDDRPLMEYFRALPHSDGLIVDLSGIGGSAARILQ